MSFLAELEVKSKDCNLVFKNFGNGHIQIKGIYSVNVYESTSSFYINGMAMKQKYPSRGPADFLILLAQGKMNFENSTPWKNDKRQKLSREKKLNLWKKDPTCWICKMKIENTSDLTWEHKIPLNKGGSNRNDNLTISHAMCNHARGNNVEVKRESSGS